jgi:hypothetical protein
MPKLLPVIQNQGYCPALGTRPIALPFAAIIVFSACRVISDVCLVSLTEHHVINEVSSRFFNKNNVFTQNHMNIYLCAGRQ